MGADKPQARKHGTQTQTPFPLILIGVVLLLATIALFSKIDFQGENEVPKLSPEDKAKLEKRLREIDDSEQYALVARNKGWYPCLHSGRTTFYLKDGEVWKYGVTSKGQFGRYSSSFLFKNKVFYVVQFKGNFSECLKQEQIRLFNYTNLPENLARLPGERLPRPPYNPVMR
ncbi:MAG: hypothetical protein KDC61_10595 [Saprospiraceae bacterium]|nr:hypothetical protein [Saprospiraceae bacterium]